MADQLPAWLSDYEDVVQKPDAGWCAVSRFAFTFAILAGCDYAGYRDRWCYDSRAEAKRALAAWSGVKGTEPDGWHRHPDSGRRRPDSDPEREYVTP